MTALRVLNLLIWLPILMATTPAVVRIIIGRSQPDDPVRLTWFLSAFVFIGFVTRWLAMPQSQEAFAVLYTLSALAGVTIGLVARAYAKSR